ncbi:MAG: aminoglycoside 6-adenylyltransferase [Acidobacteria bacterium]|nr:aminoglycoside 6-adenylyltransferase [Acidobacteriota bacterium]
MNQQQRMLSEIKATSEQDKAIVAAMLYGSFALGEADEYSDLDVVLFVSDTELNDAESQRLWLSRLAPVHLFFINEFGVPTAIFDNLVRGEFHFNKASRMADVVKSWHPDLYFPSLESALLIDKTGELRQYLRPFIRGPVHYGQETHRVILNNCLNWMVFGLAVIQRGEYARALELLNMLHRNLLRLIRIKNQSTIHWLTPSRFAEQDLKPETMARFAACTAPLDTKALWAAYRNAWNWIREIIAESEETAFSQSLITQITARFQGHPHDLSIEVISPLVG